MLIFLPSPFELELTIHAIPCGIKTVSTFVLSPRGSERRRKTHRRLCGAAAKSLILPTAVGKADLKSHIGISTFTKFRQRAVEIQRISGGWSQPCPAGERLLHMQKPRLRMTPPESRLNACVELFKEVKFCSYVVSYVFVVSKTVRSALHCQAG